jgi:hypothetical protein
LASLSDAPVFADVLNMATVQCSGVLSLAQTYSTVQRSESGLSRFLSADALRLLWETGRW